jgi:hypothetical protein
MTVKKENVTLHPPRKILTIRKAGPSIRFEDAKGIPVSSSEKIKKNLFRVKK